MATSYPGAIDTFTNPRGAIDNLDAAVVPHDAQHANANDAIKAIETLLGANGANYVSVAGAQTISGSKTFSALLTAAGVDSTGSPTGYNAEFRFNNTAANASCGLSTVGTGAPIMHFDHRATNNTGVWQWRNGTGGGSIRMSLDGSGNLSSGAGVGTGGRAVVGNNAVTIGNAGQDSPVPGGGDGTLYVLNGVLKYRGAGGTITTLAAS